MTTPPLPANLVPVPQPAAVALEREFMQIRCRILEIAAALDRIDRGSGDLSADPRTAQLHAALAILVAPAAVPDRAERVQTLFSDPFDPDWFSRFVPTR